MKVSDLIINCLEVEVKYVFGIVEKRRCLISLVNGNFEYY